MYAKRTLLHRMKGTRKTAPLKDSERKELKNIMRGYGLQKEFIERSKITYPTLNRLAKNGYGLESTVEKVRKALMPHAATKEAVIEAVKSMLGVNDAELVKDGSDQRRITAYLLAMETTMSLSAIARELHYKDHTAVIRAIRGVENSMDVDREFRGKADRCRRAIERTPVND